MATNIGINFKKNSYASVELAKADATNGVIVFDTTSKTIFVGGVAFDGGFQVKDAYFDEERNNALVIVKTDGNELIVNIGELTDSPIYGNEDIDETLYTLLNEENKIDSTSDTMGSAIAKLDNKGQIIMNELLNDEETITKAFSDIQDTLSLNDDFTLGPLKGTYIKNDITLGSALKHLDNAISQAGKIDDVQIDGHSVLYGKTAQLWTNNNDYDEEENPLVTWQDLQNAGKVKDVKINNNTIVDVYSKEANIGVDGSYNYNNNKIATQSTINNAIGTMTASPIYGDETIDPNVNEAFNETYRVNSTDTASSAIAKLDNKGKVIVDELIKDENVIYEGFNSLRNSVGLNNKLELVGLEGDIIGDDTNVKDALNHLDKTLKVLGELEDSPIYGDDTIDPDVYESFNETYKVNTTDTLSSAISKLDNKGKVIVDEIINNEKLINVSLYNIKESVGLTNDFKLEPFVGDYVEDAETMYQAIEMLDAAIKSSSGNIEDVQIGSTSIVTNKIATIRTTGTYDSNSSQIVTQDTLGELVESPIYGSETLSDDLKTAFNVTNQVNTTESISSAISKVDNKGKIIVDEIIKNEQIISQSFNTLKESVGLNNNLQLSPLSGNYVNGDTDIVSAILHLDAAIKSLSDRLASWDEYVDPNATN